MNGETSYSPNSKSKKFCTGKCILGACCGCWTVFLFILIDGYLGITYLLENNHEYSSPTCFENECLKSHIEIASFIVPEVDPCQDFHGFVCGNFIKTSHKDHVSTPMQKEMHRIQNELNHYITGKPLQGDSDMISLQKQFFQSCLDGDTNQRLLSLLEQLGGWPILKHRDWNEGAFNWTQVMMKARHLGLPFEWFLTLGVQYRENTNIIEISFDKKCNPFIANSSLFMADVVVKMSAPKSVDEFNNVTSFKQQIKKICNDNKDANMYTMTIGELKRICPKYDWVDLIANLTGIQDIPQDTEIATDIGNYIRQLDELLVKTSKRVQANFIMWYIVEEFLLDLSEPIRSLSAPVMEIADLNRVSMCFEETKNLFPYVSEAEFIRQYTPPNVKADVEEIASVIKEQIKYYITESNMYTNESKSAFLEKLEELNVTIGCQAKVFDEDYFNTHYLHLEALNFTSSSIIDMKSEIEKAYYDSLFSSIGQEGIDEDFDSILAECVELRPFLTPQNELIIPAALLSDFYYDFERPSYLKFGGLGTLIAQSIFEIFKQKDENGVYVASDIGFSTIYHEYREAFHQTADPVVIEKIYYNTLARDIAFEAYVHVKEDSEKTLANSDYSPDQLFWIQSSLAFCFNDLRDEELNVNSEALQYLNIGPLKHSTYFGEVFECEAGAPMNPRSKWREFS